MTSLCFECGHQHSGCSTAGLRSAALTEPQDVGDGDGDGHAVLVHLALSEEFGTEQERDAVLALEDRLEQVIAEADVGEVDANEFGDGEVILYLYGPDKDRLWAVREVMAECPLRPAFALLQGADPDVHSERVQLPD